MRVLLVYSNQSSDLLPAPPIGLSYVATATEAAGHQVRFLDLLIARKPLETLSATVRQFDPEIVGFSVRNIDNVVCQKTQSHLGQLASQLAIVRQQSKAKIVLGGPAITILAETALKRLDADFAILGEGEQTFPALLAAIERDQPLDRVPGVLSCQDGRIISSPPLRLESFGASGMERWVNWRTYERKGGTWTLQTKRGCPMQCSYCAYPALEGRNSRRRPAEDVVDEIERVQRTIGPRTFEIVDSTFNVPVDHAVGICEEILRRGLKLNLTAMGINPLTVTAELFALMKRAGFKSMMITPESADDIVLQNLSKGFSTEHVHRTAELAKASGLSSMWFFMMGGPGETRETVESTARFVEERLTWKNCLTIFMVGLRVLPGTALARRVMEEGAVRFDADLSEPVFYFSPHVDEAWILRRINGIIARNPAVVHAAEEGGSVAERLMDRALHFVGVPPPYWRFLPGFLRLRPVHRLRTQRPCVGEPAGLS